MATVVTVGFFVGLFALGKWILGDYSGTKEEDQAELRWQAAWDIHKHTH